MIKTLEQLANALGTKATVFPSWGKLLLRIDTPVRYEIVAAKPAGIDMNKVAATMDAIEKFCLGRTDAGAFGSELEAVGRLTGVSTPRFALLAGAGAAALGVIFGATHVFSLVLIALSAASGAFLRRWLAKISADFFVQPFGAALLAGILGAIAARLRFSSSLHLVAVCPCMVLVPGPHFLNGMIDLARARITLGVSRIVYALLIVVMISAGLIIGLATGGLSLPAAGPSYPVPLGYDVIAAGVAVSAFCTFFAMPWRMMPIPILIGMLAHALRWVSISLAGTNAAIGAFLACLLVGATVTPIAERARLPFAALAFASVVSLIPGVFLFRMASGLVVLVELGSKVPPDLPVQVLADASLAILIILAMSFGLILPKMCIQGTSRHRS
jgi:uncharacterized membrane protein YjjB (DUF3815 family)